MTTPGDFSAGDDFVAARLSIEIPDDAVESIREITTAVDSYRTTLEAAARAEADMTRYLEQMAEATKSASVAQQNLIAQMQQMMSLASRGGAAPLSGVPTGTMVNPFQGSAGTGAYQTGGLGAPPGQRPPNPADVAVQLGQAQSSNPREWLNMQHARGGVTDQDTINISHGSIQELANKIAQREHEQREQLLHTQAEAPREPQPSGTGSRSSAQQRVVRAATMAGQVANELSTQGVSGLKNVAARGLDYLSNMRRSQAAPGRQGPPATTGTDTDIDPNTPGGPDGGKPDDPAAEQTMGLTKVLKMIPAVGGALASLAGAFGLVQSGGQMIQGWRNTAALRGGAAGEGAQVAFKAKVLAMNPFLTSDQARQIYQAAMSEGYADATGSGPAADDVMSFMSQNLTSMNIKIADSVKMLRGQILGSGKGDPASVTGAVESLRHELDAIRSLSRNSVMSTPDYVETVGGLKETLMRAGATPEGASTTAITATEMYSGDQAMKGQMASLTGDMAQGATAGAMLRNFGGPGGTPRRDVAGLFTPVIPAYLASKNLLPEAIKNTLKHFARIAAFHDRGDEKSHRNAIFLFQQHLASVAPDHEGVTDYRIADMLYREALGGGEDQELQAAGQRLSDVGIGSPGGGGGGGGGGGNSIPFQALAPRQAPAGTPVANNSGPGAVTDVPSTPPDRGGGGGRGGGAPATVQIALTPEAAKLIQVMGPTAVQIPTNKRLANQGVAGQQVNSR